MKTVLVTGGSGQLGRELARAQWPAGWQVRATTRNELDLARPEAVAAAVAAQSYAAIINAGAYTAVDKAEAEPLAAWMVNALAPAALARAARDAGIPIVQVSTDYVFDGSGIAAWTPGAPTGPLSVYGASKLGGEWAVRTSGARYAIVRTSWVVSANGSNFVQTMLRLAAERDELRVVEDQVGAPTSAADLAVALVRITVAMSEGAQSGVWHYANAGEVSWRGFAETIFRQSGIRGGPSARVMGIPTSEYPTPARRPLNSRLDCSDTIRDFGVVQRPWQDGLGDILDDLIGPAR